MLNNPPLIRKIFSNFILVFVGFLTTLIQQYHFFLGGFVRQTPRVYSPHQYQYVITTLMQMKYNKSCFWLDMSTIYRRKVR